MQFIKYVKGPQRRGDGVLRKKYLHVLRPLLASRWLREQGRTAAAPAAHADDGANDGGGGGGGGGGGDGGGGGRGGRGRGRGGGDGSGSGGDGGGAFGDGSGGWPSPPSAASALWPPLRLTELLDAVVTLPEVTRVATLALLEPPAVREQLRVVGPPCADLDVAIATMLQVRRPERRGGVHLPRGEVNTNERCSLPTGGAGRGWLPRQAGGSAQRGHLSLCCQRCRLG